MTQSLGDGLLQHEVNQLRVLDQWEAHAARLGYGRLPRQRDNQRDNQPTPLWPELWSQAAFPAYLQTRGCVRSQVF